MLRVHCVQLFYNLSDPATEDMLYEIERVRRFTGISLSKAPEETTILNFRHLLERHGLPQVLFESIKNHLSEAGLMLKEGTIVDASIMEAPSSTKNRKRERDPEMKQTRKGNQWHLGMKLHVGVDDQRDIPTDMQLLIAWRQNWPCRCRGCADRLIHCRIRPWPIPLMVVCSHLYAIGGAVVKTRDDRVQEVL